MNAEQDTRTTRRPGTAERLVAWLRSGAAFGGCAVEVVETHMSLIFLTPDRAWKLKRPVRFSFADFSTPEARRAACEREVEVNRMYPSGLYLGVRPVTRTAAGFALGGSGEPVDWLVEMKRFDRREEFDKLAVRGALEGGHIDALADAVAAQHLAAAPVTDPAKGQPPGETAANIGATLADHADGGALAEAVAHWRRQVSAALDGAGPLLNQRRAGGLVKRCHGDLHLANICLVDGRPMPFDAIEFSEEIATVDVLYDAAFTVMDLIFFGERGLANRFLNRYLSATGDYAGTALLPLFLSIRAAVRGMAALLSSGGGAEEREAGAAARLDLASHSLESPPPPALIAIGGLSGTGKSTVAAALSPERAPGAGCVVLRTDMIRKRLAGIAPETTLPAESYTRSHSAAVYARMLAQAAEALSAGQTVILDAVFLDPREREAAAALAARHRCPFHGLWLEVEDIAALEARIESRAHDPSDATPGVLRFQSGRDPGRIGWHRIASGRRLDDVLADSLRLTGSGA